MFEVLVTYRPDFVEQVAERCATLAEAQEIARQLAAQRRDHVIRIWVRQTREAEAPEGRAHVIDVKGADEFSARLFVDVQTHRPLMLTFKGQLPRMRTVRASGPADMARARAEADRAGQAAAQAPESEIRLFVSEYREVQGVLLPHRFLREADGGSSEEWTVKSWTVNPELKADAFRKQR